LICDKIVIMTDWRICGGIQRIDICYSKGSRTYCSKLATRKGFDFDLIIPLWKPAYYFTIKLMCSKHALFMFKLYFLQMHFVLNLLVIKISVSIKSLVHVSTYFKWCDHITLLCLLLWLVRVFHVLLQCNYFIMNM
jgi:hypothetical protein